MLIKAGVDISRLNPEIRGALGDAEVVCMDNKDELVVTSTFDGNHMTESYHYGNDAFDFVGRYDFKAMYGHRLRGRLADYFDVVGEGNHIHVEFDRNKYNEQRRS